MTVWARWAEGVFDIFFLLCTSLMTRNTGLCVVDDGVAKVCDDVPRTFFEGWYWFRLNMWLFAGVTVMKELVSGG